MDENVFAHFEDAKMKAIHQLSYFWRFVPIHQAPCTHPPLYVDPWLINENVIFQTNIFPRLINGIVIFQTKIFVDIVIDMNQNCQTHI